MVNYGAAENHGKSRRELKFFDVFLIYKRIFIMAKAWYLYNGSGDPNSSISYTLYNPLDLTAVAPCPDGCRLCAIKSNTGPGRPVSPLSNNVRTYLSNFFIAQKAQPPFTRAVYVVGKAPC
ncbi:hypothetical protein LY11_02098 [Pedobacter cryoconitis]|uniref:Uncharacterized protein n=1 Tax=Pedobacter cryoconitis TaxID=188932 RepID=A0A327SRR4_9SPHI|nr:hypothetical protein LY11_02098 [Pedobacter cryoconitis]